MSDSYGLMDIERKAAMCVSKTIFTLANELFVWKLLLFPEIKFTFFCWEMCVYIGYFDVAVIRHHDQNNSLKKVFILAYNSRGPASFMTMMAWHQAAGIAAQVGCCAFPSGTKSRK